MIADLLVHFHVRPTRGCVREVWRTGGRGRRRDRLGGNTKGCAPRQAQQPERKDRYTLVPFREGRAVGGSKCGAAAVRPGFARGGVGSLGNSGTGGCRRCAARPAHRRRAGDDRRPRPAHCRGSAPPSRLPLVVRPFRARSWRPADTVAGWLRRAPPRTWGWGALRASAPNAAAMVRVGRTEREDGPTAAARPDESTLAAHGLYIGAGAAASLSAVPAHPPCQPPSSTTESVTPIPVERRKGSRHAHN